LGTKLMKLCAHIADTNNTFCKVLCTDEADHTSHHSEGTAG